MSNSEKKIGNLLRALGPTPRIQILLAIGAREACVCHLEALLGLRQAYISQHLMALRKANVLLSRKEGRFVYYRLRDPRVLDLIKLAAEVAQVESPEGVRSPAGCGCPSCEVVTTAAAG